MKIDVMMTPTPDDMSSTKTRLVETKVRPHQRKAPSYSRLAEQISAESFQVDLNARSASATTWLEERERSTNPDMDMEMSTRFGSKSDSGLLEGGDVDSAYWTRTSDEGSPVALASVDEDFHSAIRSLETGTSEDSRMLSETPRKMKGPRGQAEDYSEEKGSEGHLAPSPMESDISSFFPTSKNTSGTKSPGILSSKIQGLSPRQRLLYRYKLEELMSGSHNEEANGGAGLVDESPELSALPEHTMDSQLDGGSSPCYIDAPESSESWQTSKSGGAEIEDLPVHPVTGLLHDCHICGYVPFSRDDYDVHMKKTHFTHKCHLCIYWSRSPGRLNHHMKKFHSEPGDAPANKKPKNPRKYTCKQCKYFTYVQEEIWNHTRIHVPASKLLSCPHCPFVCAFKHHMQYHMNNHMGYKPFKCPECNYRCNNKSMLNSHKKSHSNDYPFRCGVCNYAAKYRHALNIHLRKKKHVPDGEVLLEDRQRPTRTRTKANQGQRNRMEDVANGFPDEMGHSMSWAESQMNGIMDPVSIKEDPERMNISLNASFSHSQPQQPAYALPGANMQPPLIPISELPFHLMNPNYSSVITSCPMPTLTTAFAQNHRTIPPQLKSFVPSHGVSIPIIPAPPSHISQDHSTLYETSPPPPGVYSNSRQVPARSNYQTFYEGQEQESMVHRSPRHYALETVQDFTNDSAEEWPLDLTAKSKESKTRDTDRAQSWQASSESPKSLQASRQSPRLDWYECQHCGIIFPDQILYSMHMGYHNKADPFQCNLCGQRTKDRRDFFSHISMVAHD